MLINIGKLKEIMDEVISHLEARVEGSEQSGDYEFAKLTQEELDHIQEGRKILDDYQDSDTHLQIVKMNILPEFNFDLLFGNYEFITNQKVVRLKLEAERLSGDLDIIREYERGD